MEHNEDESSGGTGVSMGGQGCGERERYDSHVCSSMGMCGTVGCLGLTHAPGGLPAAGLAAAERLV